MPSGSGQGPGWQEGGCGNLFEWSCKGGTVGKKKMGKNKMATTTTMATASMTKTTKDTQSQGRCCCCCCYCCCCYYYHDDPDDPLDSHGAHRVAPAEGNRRGGKKKRQTWPASNAITCIHVQ
ncbi:hypothetical protein ACJQWK_08748 [Exserohilum turcicum]